MKKTNAFVEAIEQETIAFNKKWELWIKIIEEQKYTKNELIEFLAFEFVDNDKLLDKQNRKHLREIKKTIDKKSKAAKKSADAKHSPINAKKEELVTIWKSGIYKTKNDCADKEYKRLNISYETARKALRNQ